MPFRTLAVALAVLAAAPAAAQVDLAAVDAHADATPEKAEGSVRSLAKYLARAGETDLARARAIFRWLAMNVAYDVSGFRTGDYSDLSPDAVLRRRRAVCSGYAGLAEALGEAMGLEIEVVHGWSKGYGYLAGQTFDGPTNHAWNAVRIDGAWRLMDPTWGAGYLDASMQFVRRFEEHYFLTDPGSFVFDHLPEAPSWQLLDPPVSGGAYADMVQLRPHFFANGLEIRSHPRARIETGDRATVVLGTTDDVLLLARLRDADADEELEDTRTFVQTDDGEARIDFVVPRPGAYILRLFARGPDDDTYHWALDYRVDASAGDEDGGFPLAYSGFGERGAVLYEPMEGTLAAGESHAFRIRAPGAVQVAVVAGGTWTYLARGEDDVFHGDVLDVPGDINVYAEYDAEGQFTGLLRYRGR